MDASAAELYREFKKGRGVVDLSNRVKLTVHGADRVRYLNGQVTRNVTALQPQTAQPACVLSPKGKLAAEIWISAVSDDALWVDADEALRDTLPGRLARYIIADDVTIEDASAEWKLVHVWGSLGDAGLPPSVRIVAARRFGSAGTDCWIPASIFADFFPVLAADRALLDDALLESIRIERGIPRWARELDEQTLPPEAGLDRTHVDYQKGCYVGQEVVSRLKSVGHVNRALIGYVTADHRSSLTAPMAVSAAGVAQSVGQITSASWSFALERHVGLGYLKRAAPTSGLTAHDGATGASIGVTVHELPFVP
jgi:folate-binding protein YgfZ